MRVLIAGVQMEGGVMPDELRQRILFATTASSSLSANPATLEDRISLRGAETRKRPQPPRLRKKWRSYFSFDL